MDWKIVYLDTLEEWISQLNKMQLKSLAKELKLLELCGNKIKLPHSKALGAGLFELRERKFGLR
ncbi:MAG: type II toxin-antitoxin system RelE/ParE family toxin, partial [Gammaproteobacteria bacterium]